MLAKFPRAWLPSRECESIRPIRSHPSHHSPYIYPCFGLQGPGCLPGKQSGHQGENQSDRHVSQHPSETLAQRPKPSTRVGPFLLLFSGMGRKTKNLDRPQANQCQLLMMLVMLGLWKPFMKHVKLTFKANKPHSQQFKVLPPNLTAISLRFCHPLPSSSRIPLPCFLGSCGDILAVTKQGSHREPRDSVVRGQPHRLA